MPTDSILGQILLGRYRPLRLLGAGAHGRVYLAEDLVRGGERVALKLVEGLIGGGMDSAAQRMLRWFRHPGWAEVLDEGRFGPHDWFQAMRFVDGRSLDQLSGPQSVEMVWRFLEDGARVLRALHLRGLIHYDITPGNWLQEGPENAPRHVLTDGGLAHVGPVTGFARGSPRYLAPEMTEDRPHDHRVDLYALGLIAYRLATGEDAQQGGAGEVLGQRRRGLAPHPRERRPDLPLELDTLIAALLEPDPTRRIADGDDLIARLRAARPGTPEVRAAEAVAAATSGPIVGCEQPLQRFTRSTAALAQHLTAPDEERNASPPAPEHVLLLEGAPGCGATRLAREMAAAARREELPVMLLAGREGAPDRRNPLRRLVDGLVTLQRSSARPVRGSAPVVLAARGETFDAESGAHAEGRAIERFLAVVEETARRTPLVLVVEDLSDLPPLAQEAIRVLSRHLLARAERTSGQAPLPLTLVVDLGEEPAEHLVNADAADPRHAVIALAPLGVDEIAALCRDRFPGLDLPQGDLEALLATSDGQPAHLTALLAEAYQRGDLKRDGGAWTWDLSRLTSYGPPRRLPPAVEEALRAAPAALRAWLDRVALGESEMPLAAARALWSRMGTGDLPTSSLLSIREHGETIVVALVSPALRRALLASMDPSAQLAAGEDLLAALERHPDPRTLLDRIALRARLGRPEAALALAHMQRAELTYDQRQALQPLLLRLVEAHDRLLDDPAARGELVALLDRGTEAAALAGRLAQRLPRTAAALPDVLLVAQALDAAYDFVAVEALLRIHAATETPDVAAAAAVHVGLARALFALRRPTDAQAPLATARLLLRRLRPRTRTHARLAVEYLKVLANHHYDENRLHAARRELETALRLTRRTRARQLHVTVLNNLGLVHRAASNHKAAERCLDRALRLRVRLGDVRGAIAGYFNLALVNLDRGQAAIAGARLQTAAGLATRHARLPQLVAVLSQLGVALDQQMSPTAALDCLSRGLRVGLRCDQVQRGAEIAHLLAPLAASAGAAGAVRTSLLASARAARLRAFTDARGLHHLAVAQTALVLGQPTTAARAVRRAGRHTSTLQPTARVARAVIAALASPGALASRELLANRPPRGERLRTAYGLALRLIPRGHRSPTPPTSGPRWARVIAATLSMHPVERRLLADVVLADAALNSGAAPALVWRRAHELLSRAGTPVHQARLNALQAQFDSTASNAQRAALFSKSLAAIPLATSALPRALLPPSVEHVGACTALAAGAGVLVPLPPHALELHAIAHVLSGQPQASAGRAARREEALRLVLAATSRIEPSVQLEALLDRLTRSTAEITGAQRACVVLVEADPPGQMRVATSVTSEGGPLTDQDLSHTVIQRVLASRKALLLHDAFSDDELLSRPSITTLALRSILCVPMLRDGALLGVMYADSSAGAGSFDQVDLEVLTLLADQAASAIATNRLVNKLQRAYAEVRTMQDRLVKSERLRVLGEVSSGVAHEFNNLLTAILARVQLMGLSVMEKEQSAHLALIEKATMDAAGVVRRLQTFSRTQRTNTFVNVSVAEVCSDAIEFLRPLWSTRRRHGRPAISVRLACDPSLRVTGNPTELREVLTNLIKNALDALADRGGTIVVQADRQDEGIDIKVQDDGVGIPNEVLAKVFDPFFTTKGERGTGLGLCLSQRIAEQHGGDLTLTSGPGKGTTAHMRLPHPSASATPLPGFIGSLDESLPHKPIRILIVDDDSDVLRPLCSYLERSGYEVAAAQNGLEALAQLKQGTPDVLLTDIGMPKMDGLELCRQAMAMEPQLPVVLMSGWASEVDPVRARAAGAQALLAKPFAMQQVSELLIRLARGPNQSG